MLYYNCSKGERNQIERVKILSKKFEKPLDKRNKK